MEKKTAEELIAIIEQGSSQPKKRKKIESNASTLRYIRENNIESGLVAVPNAVIFHHYCTKWPGEMKHKANKVVFFRTFNQHFKTVRKTFQRFYLIKEGIYDLSPENVAAAELYNKKYVRFSTGSKKKKKETENKWEGRAVDVNGGSLTIEVLEEAAQIATDKAGKP